MTTLVVLTVLLVVVVVAVLAALRDSRFRPVGAGELNRLEYEISVLSPFHKVTDWKQIRVGHHGLVVRQGESEGVLLPQVAVEQRWDRTTFLNEVCPNAGLPSRCWQAESAALFLFTAWVLGEHRLVKPLNLDEPFPQRPTQPQGGLPPGSPPQ